MIIIIADTITVNSSGNISSRGVDAPVADGGDTGAGGAGAGGSIKLTANTADLSTDRVTALGGSYTVGGTRAGGGGGGGLGRIRIEVDAANLTTGGTDPAYDRGDTPGGGSGSISETGSATNVGGGTTVSITHGQTIAANDVIVAMIHSNDAGNDITDNNGAYAFTEEFEETNSSETSTYAIYYRVAGASEPATYSWNIDNNTEWSVQIRIFSGVDTASVWDVAPSASTRSSAGSGTTATAPTMTTSNDGAMGIIAIFSDSTETFSNPTNGYGTEVEPASSIAQASYIRTWASAGATGTSSADLSASNDWLAHQFALKPAADTSATWAAAQDTKLTDLPKNTIKRLRFLIDNSGGQTSGAVAYQLQVAETGTCSSGSYSAVSGTEWEIVDSGLTDNDATTNVTDGLDDPGASSFTPGEQEESGNTTEPITLASLQFTEIEFSIQALAGATNGGDYCFKLVDSVGGDLDNYAQYAAVSIEAVNSAPTAPTTLYSNNTTAQDGQTNPTGITDPTLAFSAIYNDPDSGDIANKYRVEVNTQSDFGGTVMWDSGAGGTSMTDTTADSRSPDIIYAGSALADSTQYFWRITFWDDGDTEGTVSATQNFTTGEISCYDLFDYSKSITIDRTKIANPALLPIAFDAVSSAETVPAGGATSLTWSHTVGSGEDPILVVGVSIRNDSSQQVSSVTYNGTALTKIDVVDNSTYVRAELWYLPGASFPAPGTYDVVVNMSAAARFVAGAFSMFNVDPTTPLGTFTSNSGSGNPTWAATADIPSASGEIVVAILAKQYDDPVDPVQNEHQADRWNLLTNDASASNVRGVGTLRGGAAPDTTPYWGLGGSTNGQQWAIAGVSVKPTTVAASQVATLTDYPLLYSVTDTDLQAHVTNANGWDIIFRGLDDTTCGGAGLAPCILDHEIEDYESTSGKLVAWVRLPSVNGVGAASDTVIYIYYGNTCISAPTENKSGVWDSNYMEVFHLSEDSGDANDSTSNGYIAAVQADPGTPTHPDAKIGGGYQFASDSWLLTNDGQFNTANAPLTIEGWFHIDSGWHNQANISGGAALSTGTWYYAAITFDGGIRTGFRNGQRDTVVTSPNPSPGIYQRPDRRRHDGRHNRRGARFHCGAFTGLDLKLLQ
jgi:hypothetical protein